MQERCISRSDEYKVITSLGRGSQGEVFLVEGKDGERYAMKVGEKTDLMEQESALLKRLNHPIFPAWKHYIQAENGKLIMEYIEGITLQKYMDVVGRPSRSLAKYIMIEVLEGLEYLHMQNPPVIFRDLKPENIMVARDGRVRIIDLGSALSEGYKVGSLGYAAPEQFWEGTHPMPQWDIYAAGKLLAYLITGKNPCEPPYNMLSFCGKNRAITAAMYKVLQRSLADQYMGRYDSVREFKEEMKSAFASYKANKWNVLLKKRQIVYEKCVWKSEYQRIF